MQQWHDVAKDARRVGVAKNDGGTVYTKKVELDGLDSLFFLADDLRVFHPGLGVRAHCCHDPAHTSASSPGGTAKGLWVGDFDLAQLLLGHLRTAFNAASATSTPWTCGATSSSMPVHVYDHVDNHPGNLGVGEGVRLAACNHQHLLAQRALDQKLNDASAHVPRRAQHDRRVLRLRIAAAAAIVTSHTRGTAGFGSGERKIEVSKR